MNENLETEREDVLLGWVLLVVFVVLTVFAAIGIATLVNANRVC